MARPAPSVVRLLLHLLLALPLAGFAQDSREALFNLVTLSALAEREVANDLMSAVLSAEAEGADPAVLAAGVARTMKQALEAAQGARGVKARSGAYHTWPVYEKNRIVRWRVRQELRLESGDFAAATELIGRLQASLVVANISLGLSGEVRRQTENALIGEAIAAFNERAALARDAMKAKGYRMQSLNISSAGPQLRQFAAPMRALGAEAAPPAVEPGTSRIAVNVSGTVQLQP